MEKKEVYSGNIVPELFEIVDRIKETIENYLLRIKTKESYYNIEVHYAHKTGLLYKIEVWKESENHSHFNPYFTIERKDKKPGSITFEAKDIKKILEVYKTLKGLEKIITN